MQPAGTRAAVAVLTVVALGALLAPTASAGVYSDNKSHYHFTFPDSWTESSVAHTDVVYLGPTTDGFAASVVASSGKENQARDTATWLLNYTELAYNDVNASLTVNQTQAPRTFTTAAGRLAADYAFEHNDSTNLLHQRQVIFVSQFWKTTVVLTFSDVASNYTNREADWALMVDSFGFDGEPQIPSDLVITIDGGNNTTVQPNATVHFAINQTLPNGLVIQWFRNGTSVGNGTQVDLQMPAGTAVISVQISNATADRTLTTTITAGTATTTPPTPPPPGATSTGMSSWVIPGIVLLLALTALLGYALVRARKRVQKSPSEGTPPASSDSPPGPPRNL